MYNNLNTFNGQSGAPVFAYKANVNDTTFYSA